MFWKSRKAKSDISSVCACEICKNRNDFSLPEHLKRKLYSRDLVVFAGAGISTENRAVFPYTLYDDVKAELGLNAESSMPFSTVMEKYCAQPDGRALLLQKIRKRFDYISSFPELHRFATLFHKELATIHLIDTIVTTNWDDLFERECGAIPLTTAEDFAFWSLPGRKVFKIHGSINNYGSIIATDKDYEACREALRDGILGSTLKHILGTKTVVYVGYSFSDSDFTQIYEFLKDEMKDVLPHSYMVTPNEAEKEAILDRGFTPIITSGEHFLSVLKMHLVADGLQIPDESFEGIRPMYGLLIKAHEDLHGRFKPHDSPLMLYTTGYQDGFMQALERAMARMCTGEYSCPGCLTGLIEKYEEIRREKEGENKLFDVAYVDGYLQGLTFIMLSEDDRTELPLWYVTGETKPAKDLDSLGAAFDVATNECPEWTKQAESLIESRLEKDGHVDLHHTPFLL